MNFEWNYVINMFIFRRTSTWDLQRKFLCGWFTQKLFFCTIKKLFKVISIFYLFGAELKKSVFLMSLLLFFFWCLYYYFFFEWFWIIKCHTFSTRNGNNFIGSIYFINARFRKFRVTVFKVIGFQSTVHFRNLLINCFKDLT